MDYYYENEEIKLIKGDCNRVLNNMVEKSVDMIFVDPTYLLSNDGITCKSGKMKSVNKGEWDKSQGFKEDVKFHRKWVKSCDRVLKDDGSIWISGTYHCIHQIAFILMEMGYYIINEISWFKPNAAPNMGCRCFTASHETLLWVKKSKKVKHTFNYSLMKEINEGKQMRSLWSIPTTPKREKLFGIHPTQKPLELLNRIILSSTNEGDVILDPFCGSSTTGVSSILNGRKYIGIDISNEYLDLSYKRLKDLFKEEISLKQIEAKPVLKWAGGKSQLITEFEKLFPKELTENKIDTYIEPFIGGGAVFFNLTSRYDFKRIIINDINSELVLTYKVIKEAPEKLINILSKFDSRYNELAKLEEKQELYYEIRETFNSGKGKINYDIVDDISIEHAACMIFLNKSCFNGLYRENKKGGFNVPFGQKNKVNSFDLNNIIAVSQILKNVEILNYDFEKLEEFVDEKTFVYMDPPYRPLNATSNFKDYSKEEFNDESQIRLANFYKRASKKGAKLMLSNSDPKNADENDNFFDDLYTGGSITIERVMASRMINSKGTGRGKVSEIVVKNYKV